MRRIDVRIAGREARPLLDSFWSNNEKYLYLQLNHVMNIKLLFKKFIFKN